MDIKEILSQAQSMPVESENKYVLVNFEDGITLSLVVTKDYQSVEESHSVYVVLFHGEDCRRVYEDKIFRPNKKGYALMEEELEHILERYTAEKFVEKYYNLRTGVTHFLEDYFPQTILRYKMGLIPWAEVGRKVRQTMHR